MNPVVLYAAKVVLCSGVLFGYYCLALRNKTFHQWNRYFLLACIVLSLVAPLLKINIGTAYAPAPDKMLRLLNVATAEDKAVVKSSGPTAFALTAEQCAWLAYGLVSVILLFLIIANGIRIYTILRSYPKTKLGNICFLSTDARGTPFSFFHYIVWNRAIDLASENGKRIFQHELVHVQQRHTCDKVFLLLILVPFWINPFFWLMRKELAALHEFTADQQALNPSDTAVLAQMILNTAFPQQHFLFINPFFQSTIKRRIAMFTKLQHPTVSYASRIAALPLLLIVIAAFGLRTKTEYTTGSLKPVPNKESSVLETAANASAVIDTVPKITYKNKEVAQITYIKDEKDAVTIDYKDGTRETIKANEARKANLLNADTTVLTTFTPPVIKKELGSLELKDSITVRKASVEEARNFKGVIELDEKQFNGVWNDLPDQAEIDFMVFVKGNEIAKQYGVKPDEEILSVYTKKFRERTQRDNTNKPIFTQTEIEPSFAGGWQKFLQQNLKANVAVNNGAPAGTYETVTQFIVDENGNLSDFKSLTKHGYGMEEEVIRALAAGPKWKPAMQNGRKVTAYKKQKVTFVVSE